MCPGLLPYPHGTGGVLEVPREGSELQPPAPLSWHPIPFLDLEAVTAGATR